jgi:hypothetical protein
MQHPSEPMSNLFVVSANRRYDECIYYKFANLIKIIAWFVCRQAAVVGAQEISSCYGAQRFVKMTTKIIPFNPV